MLSHGLVRGRLRDALTLVCVPMNKRDSQGERREWAPQAKGMVSTRTMMMQIRGHARKCEQFGDKNVQCCV